MKAPPSPRMPLLSTRLRHLSTHTEDPDYVVTDRDRQVMRDAAQLAVWAEGVMKESREVGKGGSLLRTSDSSSRAQTRRSDTSTSSK